MQESGDIGVNKTRLSYIDVMKGLLMVLVVWDHVPDYLQKFLDDPVLGVINDTQQWTYKLFFMPAFFCITGFCTNFDIGFWKFTVKQVRTLVIPGTVMYFITIVVSEDFSFSPVSFLHVFVHSVMYIGCFWFIGALFLSKMLYYCLNRLTDNLWIILLILIAMVPLGFFMRRHFQLWFSDYAFSLAVFIGMGQLMRKYGLPRAVEVAGSVLFIVSVVFRYIAGYDPPVVAGYFMLPLKTIAPYLLLASTGTVFIWVIARLIDNCAPLEYIGRNSLIYYVFEWTAFRYVYLMLSPWLAADTPFAVVIFTIVVFLCSLVLLTAISCILNLKYLKWIVGK